MGITPDLTCLGKIIGGGLPVGAYGGRRDIMEQVAPVGPMYQAGTLSGNPLAMAAGIATLNELRKPGQYEELESKWANCWPMAWSEIIQGIGGAVGLPERIGALFCLFFTPQHVTDYASAKTSETTALRRILLAHAASRHLPAALPVRDLFHLAGPHRRDDRGDRQRHPCCPARNDLR